ncbi:alpha-tocopherol transfer protein-like [Caerostris darwini]|uniref:Alpha-tocopherol transfer protein-like n=1 Tax=Caerostris darwini TaxID=1538125 RepID=A0AAV4S0U4_9ARAC|nr:alpha-tocopherol transfer protein-like [Caerostris darwini]
MDPAPVLTEADVCRKITAATQLLTERRKLHDLATQAITKQQILMDAGLVTAKTIKASAATIKKAAEAVSDAEDQIAGFNPVKDDEFLLRFLRTKKYNVNRAFTAFRAYYSFRHHNAGCITDFLPNDLLFLFDMNKILMSPKRTEKGGGILIVSIGTLDLDLASVFQLFAGCFMAAEISLETECSQVCGTQIIFDMRDITAKKIWTYGNYKFFSLLATCIQECFPSRIGGIHSVNEPVLISYAYKTVTPFLTTKMKSRIKFHSYNLKSLHQYFPPEALPEQLGGHLPESVYTDFKAVVMRNTALINKLSSYVYKFKESKMYDQNRQGENAPNEQTTRELLKL